jgi:DNA polymerase III subunit epsilon
MLAFVKDRPMAFFDLETTGTNLQNDRVVELSIVKVFPDGEREVKTRRINPEMHIPEESAAIHGIRDEDVKDSPTFKQVSKNLYIYLEGCDLAGYNIAKFDVPMLVKEFSRSGLNFTVEDRKIVDAYSLFCKMEPRTLTAAYKYFCGKTLENAHSSQADTLATLDILESQLAKYSSFPKDMLPEGMEAFPSDLTSLHELCNQRPPDAIDPDGRFKWKEGEAVVGFGRNAGTLLRVIAIENPDFLRWMIKSDFSDAAKKIASDALKGFLPEKKR